MGTIKIGSSSNRKGVTIEPKTVLFNGDTVRYIKSGLTEIWSNIKALVPTLTDNTNVIYSYNHNTYKPYMAFDLTNTSNKKYNSDYKTDCTSEYIGYNFNIPTIVGKISLGGSNNNNVHDCNFDLEGSNDGTTWTKIASITAKKNTAEIFEINNDVPYAQIRLRCTSAQGTYPNGSGKYLISIMGLQFYGSQLVALIPNMTSNTSPSGIASASSMYNTSYDAWKAFDGSMSSNGYVPNGSDKFGSAYVQYQFEEPTKAKVVSIYNKEGNNITFVYELQLSNDGIDFTPIKTIELKAPTTNFIYYEINIDKPYKYYRFVYKSNTNNDIDVSYGFKFQLYG